MKNKIAPNPNNPFPVQGVSYVMYVKPTLKLRAWSLL